MLRSFAVQLLRVGQQARPGGQCRFVLAGPLRQLGQQFKQFGSRTAFRLALQEVDGGLWFAQSFVGGDQFAR